MTVSTKRKKKTKTNTGPKQIPVRLERSELQYLQQIQKEKDITTMNKAVVFVLKNYLKLEESLRLQAEQIKTLEMEANETNNIIRRYQDARKDLMEWEAV